MVFIIPNFLVLHFGENFYENPSKLAKLQMHEKLHKNVNENKFFFTFLCYFSLVFVKSNQSNKYFTAFYCLFLIWFLIDFKLFLFLTSPPFPLRYRNDLRPSVRQSVRNTFMFAPYLLNPLINLYEVSLICSS